jgi:ubiquinone/menaquinone biosynthesis C-methylase UbiE
MDSMSFDAIAPVYDATRTVDETCFNAALDYIVKRFPPQRFPTLFEPGIGTGRIAIPLAERGYKVTGADISPEMLKILADKLAKRPELPIQYVLKDITALDFADASFDIALAVHIFHLIPDWQQAMNEVFRILKPKAPLVLMFTGVGVEDRSIKDRYRELCADYGYEIKVLGMETKKDLPQFAAKANRRLEQVGGEWRWRQKIHVDQFVADTRARNYSHARLAPDDVHFKALDTLEKELKAQYGTLAVETENLTEINLVLLLPA